MDFSALIIISVIFLYLLYFVVQLKPVHCDKCGTRMKLDITQDPTELTSAKLGVSKKETFSMWGLTRANDIYVCEKCNNRTAKKSWML